MAKASTKKEDHTEEFGADSASPQQEKEVQSPVMDDSESISCYANFCRVSSTPEEMILDLGLNPTPYAQGKVTVPVSQRIVMNHFTAKRLLSALSMTLQKHEQAFGILETDVRRRVQQM